MKQRKRGLPQRSCGFTLIEMLVVVLIMGLLIGLVSVVTLPDARGLLRVEAERLAQLIDLGKAEASLTGQTIGWTAGGSAYRFSRFTDSGWSEIRDIDAFRERMLPAGMIISGLRVESMRPQGTIRLEFTPFAPPMFFTIELSFGTEHYVVRSAVGNVRAVAGEIDVAPAL